ncbi:hypothetical protein [Chitinimonas taiwanensis]|uniref:hypothetical protein n=1 Tax=Chitinimonas taiwanensis TaxID=240412 RepID=UPI0035B44E82
MTRLAALALLLGLPLLHGCAVITVAGAAASVATTAVSVTADVAVAAGKGAVKAGSWAIDAATADKPVHPPAPVVVEPAVVAPVAPAITSNAPLDSTPPTTPEVPGLEIRPLAE